jgi:transcriptional regulator with XRE-family HTH domain
MQLAEVRRVAGLSQTEWARVAGTSRPTLSAYEHGRKSPTLQTVERLLAAVGQVLEAQPRVQWTAVDVGRGRVAWVPSTLPRLTAADALRQVALPLDLNWSQPDRLFDLRDRADRARAYEIVLREGNPEQISAVVDGVLLVDLWPELVLPRAVRRAWAARIETTTGETCPG